MSQSKKGSVVEAVTNIAVGYIINLGVQLIVFPLNGIELSLCANVKLGLMFTLISLVRSYALRRMFNKKEEAE